MISPDAAASPALRAAESPRFSVRIRRQSYSDAIAAEESVEPSSTTITSNAG
jgi:hypothetical protein